MIGASYTVRGAARDVLNVGEMATPQAAAGEVLVRIHTSGVNPSDVKTRAGKMGPLTLPQTIPQSDGAGVIEAVGEGVESSRVGTRGLALQCEPHP